MLKPLTMSGALVFIDFFKRKGVVALLNVKQEAFCLHYAKTGNATESYKVAGYEATTERAIYANANRLLKNDKVKERLKQLADELASEKIATIKEIQEFLTSVVRGNQPEEKNYVDALGELNQYSQVNQANQIKCAELLAKMQGGFSQNLSVEPVKVVFVGEEELA